MASIISHPAVPLALFPLIWRLPRAVAILGAGIALSILPDADAIGFWMGVPYGSFMGHRGFSHSLVFAGLAAVATTYVLMPRGTTAWPWLAAALYLFASCASHGLLDALTNGGMGVAVIAPFSNRRMFFPVQPIEVSPIGVRAFFSEWGWVVLKSELKWIWTPALALAAVLVAVQAIATRRTAAT